MLCPIINITSIPQVSKINAISEKSFVVIDVNSAIKKTPISSGSGDAIIINPVKIIKYFFNTL